MNLLVRYDDLYETITAMRVFPATRHDYTRQEDNQIATRTHEGCKVRLFGSICFIDVVFDSVDDAKVFLNCIKSPWTNQRAIFRIEFNIITTETAFGESVIDLSNTKKATVTVTYR